MALGVFVALAFGEKSMIFAPLGTIFVRLLKMVIVPLILFSIVHGVSSIGDSKSLGKLGAKTLGYYLMTSILAIVVGLIFTNMIHPGNPEDAASITDGMEAFDSSKLQTNKGLGDIVIRMIPTNPVQAAASGDMLALIFFSILFGFAITLLPRDSKGYMQNLFDNLFKTMMKLTGGVVKLAPIGVFGLITKAVASAGFDLFASVGMYMLTIALGLSLHLLITLPLVFLLFTGINPVHHFRAMSSALAMAFSTSSSGATLPVTMDCVENKVNAGSKVTSFVLPLGATINMDGTALYECAGVLFIAQLLGMDLSFVQQFTVVLTAFLASVGAAGIPSAGLVMIFIVLEAVGLRGAEVGLIVGTMLAVDRPLDMYRTMINIFSDSIGAAIIAKSEGRKNLYPETL